ncbi:trypsin-like peptidase domain-containing protein [Saccharopolyspora hirsuta]|uniref:Trypsin-like peptidase domain-containing protein n=1 Tax=Saccharopolyspora hirsuta TaxID=1837 RepID=A0A5M7BFW8_SACHI|nr:trypsin-like peptidase domain-containing protein [Saccharopolyspora hirsuta]
MRTATGSAQCTSNFVFESGSKVYLGQAAHCATTGTEGQTNGCTTPSMPVGTKVRVTGASREGVLAYSSWLAMQAAGETDANACAHNDFALVELDRADVAKVNPSLPSWGGPTGLNTAGLQEGDEVVTYGSAQLRTGPADLNAKRGRSLGDSGGGWNHTIRTSMPGVPGDSGSAVLDSAGRAVGVLATLNVSPDFGSNGAGDLARELEYLRTHSSLRDVRLVTGTQGFRAQQ